MDIRYYYQSNCYNLNKKARFFCPLSYRIINILGKILPSVQSAARSFPPGYKSFPGEQKEIIEQIIEKINTIQKQIDWNQNIHEASYVVFDTETTGVYPLQGDRVISLSGVMIENGKLQENSFFDELANPLRSIPPAIVELTGISNALVAGKPTFLHVLQRFLDFIGNRILVAHCATFDLSFINIELCRYTPLRIVNPVIDTYLLAKSLFPHRNHYSLESLAEKYNVEIIGRHTSLGDSLATAQIFLNLLQELKAKDINNLQELVLFTDLHKMNNESPSLVKHF